MSKLPIRGSAREAKSIAHKKRMRNQMKIPWVAGAVEWMADRFFRESEAVTSLIKGK